MPSADPNLDRLLDAMRTQYTDPGSYPINGLDLSVNPTHGDKFVIGADTYEFRLVATSPDVTNDAYIGIEILGSATLTFAAALDAVNAENEDNEHATLFKTDGVTPAKANGTANVTALELPTNILLAIPSLTPGSDSDDMIYGPQVLAFSATLTTTEDWWGSNYNLLGGLVSTARRLHIEKIDITTAMISAGVFWLGLGFTPRGAIAKAFAANVEKAMGADTAEVADGVLIITLNGGGGDLANGNVLYVVVFE